MTTEHQTKTYENYINGQWVPAGSRETMTSTNPARPSECVGLVQNSGAEEVDAAAEAAFAAKRDWSSRSGNERAGFLNKTAEIMEKRLDEIAETMTREMGKTFPESKGETLRGIAILRYYAGEGMRRTGDVIPASDKNAFQYTTRVPLGVTGIITPWNFPVAIPLWKMAPALIYGNTVVFKPAEDAPVTAALIMECMDEAGFPAGVVNFVTGDGSVVGQRMIEHPRIHGISFTGSNAVGKKVAACAVARGAKYQLEMGGKNPIIIAEDADLEAAVEATISGGFRSTGQKCTATSRVIILKGVYEKFKQMLLDKTKSITVGDGMQKNTWMGPLVNEKQYKRVLSYMDKAASEGAALLCGGGRPDDPGLKDGYFVSPTIYENVDSKMTIGQEEIFGPVLALMKVESIEEAIDLANDVTFGLSASIFTKNLEHAFEFINKIEAGLVRVNFETAGVELQAPFGGEKGSSSGSREQGMAAMEFYTTTKTVFIKP